MVDTSRRRCDIGSATWDNVEGEKARRNKEIWRTRNCIVSSTTPEAQENTWRYTGGRQRNARWHEAYKGLMSCRMAPNVRVQDAT